MRTARLLLLVGLTTCWPSTAHADWLSWLEELSGPGPFRGDMISFTVRCKDNGKWGWCGVPEDRQGRKTSQSLVVRLGRYSSGDHPRFKDLEGTPDDDHREVHAIPVSALWMFHIHRSLHVGAGVGFMRVSGAGFSGFSKTSLTPVSAAFTPLSLLPENRGRNHSMASFVRLELDSSLFLDGFDAADFQNTRTKFDSGAEFLMRGGVVLDALALIKSASHGFKR